jgi:hypothetical protein
LFEGRPAELIQVAESCKGLFNRISTFAINLISLLPVSISKNEKKMNQIKLLIFIILVLQFTSCITEKENLCTAIKNTIEVTFEDSPPIKMKFSPFDERKMWVQVNHKNNRVWEVDFLTGKKQW